MAGYSGTPLWKKLGYKDGTSVYLDEPPKNYGELLELPHHLSVRWLSNPIPPLTFVHLFVTRANRLAEKLEHLRDQITLDGTVWVSWPKKSSAVTTDISEDKIRQLALPLGLVDVKVCAVNETWSLLKLVIRRNYRK